MLTSVCVFIGDNHSLHTQASIPWQWILLPSRNFNDVLRKRRSLLCNFMQNGARRARQCLPTFGACVVITIFHLSWSMWMHQTRSWRITRWNLYRRLSLSCKTDRCMDHSTAAQRPISTRAYKKYWSLRINRTPEINVMHS